METLQGVILSAVQYNIKMQLLKELENRHHYTGHSLVMRDLDDVKKAIVDYAFDEIDTAKKRLYLLMKQGGIA